MNERERNLTEENERLRSVIHELANVARMASEKSEHDAHIKQSERFALRSQLYRDVVGLIKEKGYRQCLHEIGGIPKDCGRDNDFNRCTELVIAIHHGMTLGEYL